MSILLIVMLGVAFFSGVRASGPDMKLSADRAYDNANLQDFRVVSTLGLTEDDIDALKAVPGVSDVEPGYNCDVFATSDKSQLVLRFMSMPERISTITLTEGRMPEKEGECLVDTNFYDRTGWKVGDTFSVEAPEDTTLSDELSTDTYTIVGVASSPLYLDFERGNTTIGSGVLTSYVYVPTSTFTVDYYTQAVLTCNGTKDLLCYSDEYEDQIDTVKDNIKDIESDRCNIRFAEVKADGTEDLDEARSQLEDAEGKISTAMNKIQDAEQEIKDGEAELADNQQKISDAEDEISTNQDKINNGWQEYNDGLDEYNSSVSQLEEKEQELQDGKAALESAEQTLADGEAKYQSGLAEYNQSLSDWNSAGYDEKLTQAESGLATAKDGLSAATNGLATAKDGLAKAQSALSAFESADEQQKEAMAASQNMTVAELQAYLEKSVTDAQSAVDTLNSQITTLTATVTQLQATVDQLQSGRNKLTQAKATLDESRNKLDTAQAEIDANRSTLENGQEQIDSAKEQLAEAKNTLDASYDELVSGQAKIDSAKAELEDNKQKLADARTTLADSKKELADAKEKFNQQITSSEEALGYGQSQITDAQNKLDDLEVPTWYVLDRSSLLSYTEYEQNAQRIVAIGNFFPLIFFLVAALVCLTTMTRMVEERRGQIGTFKALGFSDAVITWKYILYALSATVIGSVIGSVFGQIILPYFIINAYKIMYINLPTILLPQHLDLSFSAAAAAIGTTIVATLFACIRATHSVPANLMRPESPKAGKRILLEHIGFIWNHLNFSMKATFRNLFRYKKRFFMTVLGIGGCMGLLLTGFGIKDSIVAIGTKQFSLVDLHDSTVAFGDDTTSAEKDDVIKKINSMSNTEDAMLLRAVSLNASVTGASESDNDAKKSTYLIVPSDPSGFQAFISMHDRNHPELQYSITDDGVVIDEKLSKLLNITAGDTFIIWKSDTESVEVKVSAVMENYFYHYVYMSPAYYTSVFGEEPENNTVYVNLKDTSTGAEDEFRSEVMKDDSVTGLSFTTSMADRITDMLKSMDAIIYVIVLAAGALAFIVLYNLNNINTEERTRELATLKVLGFNEHEVSSYVLRENIWLTAIGAAMGVVFGIILHHFVIITAEIDIMMFGRQIKGISFVYSIALTVFFSMFVNFIMHFRIRKINMVESMKSVE